MTDQPKDYIPEVAKAEPRRGRSKPKQKEEPDTYRFKLEAFHASVRYIFGRPQSFESSSRFLCPQGFGWKGKYRALPSGTFWNKRPKFDTRPSPTGV